MYLEGGSISGTASWRLLVRYPDLFAAAKIDYGFTTGTQVVHIANACNVPVWNYHDIDDHMVPVSDSRSSCKLLSSLHCPLVYSETVGGGHSGRKKDKSWNRRDWLLEQTRNPFPEHITYTTSTPLRGSSYWISILEFTDPNAYATVRAKVFPSRERSQLFLDLDNVDVVKIRAAHELFPSDTPLRIFVEGSPLNVAPPLPESLYVHRLNDSTGTKRCAVSEADPRPQTAYRQYAASGLNSLYVSGEPLLIVRATKGRDRELLKAIESFCSGLSRANRGWRPFPLEESMTGAIPVKTDREITAADIEGHNLIIVGPASANRLLAQITDKLPAAETSDSLRFNNASHALADVAYGLYYYNPLAPKRFILVMSSANAAFYESLNNGIADLMHEERPFGLTILRLEQKRHIRKVMWNKDWSVPESALSGQLLPPVFSTDSATVRELHLKAFLGATGADYVSYWKPNYNAVWEQGARWHDIEAEMGQSIDVKIGLVSGADVEKLCGSLKPGLANLGTYPLFDSTATARSLDYRYATSNAKFFQNIVKHPLRNPVYRRIPAMTLVNEMKKLTRDEID